MTTALFDKDGVCVMVSDHPPRQPPGGAKAEVPTGTLPGDIWWDGEAVQAVADTALDVPRIVDHGAETVTIDLPPGTVANVNGKRHRGRVTISTTSLGQTFVDIRGAQRGNFLVDVVDYAGRRKAAYPPLTDYLDGVAKGDQAQIDAYLAACRAVKDTYPKP